MEIIYNNIATPYVGRLKDNYNSTNVASRNQQFGAKTSLHRIIPVSRIKEIFEGRMTLVNPCLWEKNDPYENFLHKIEFRDEKLKGKAFPDKDNFYAQCWSMEKNSYALWKIYTEQERGIMISTSVEKLANSLSTESDLFMGAIEYLSVEELKLLINESPGIKEKIFNPGYYGKIEALLIKRTPYQYEQEVRLIKYSKENDKKLYKLSGFDPKSLISKITLDPRMSDIEEIAFKKYFKSIGYKNVGGKKDEGGRRVIEKSRMLTPEPIFI